MNQDNTAFVKLLITIGMLAYVVAPIDLMPGVPIDDAIIILVGMAAKRAMSMKKSPLMRDVVNPDAE